MTLSANLPPDLLPPRVRPADRLGFTLFLAALLHIALILGVSFSVSTPKPVRQTLDFTLSTFQSEKPPEKADFLAQDNQQGSGTLEKKAVPTTTEVAPFQDSKVNTISPPPAPRREVPPPPQKAVVTTKAPKPTKVEPRPKESKPQPKPAAPAPDFDSSQLSSQIASLEAELSNEQQLYAKRPRIHRLNAASTTRDKGAWYKEDWRKKIERIGNLNYPQEARSQKLYGSLRLMVSINRDGSLHEVLVLESSGQPLLDQAAQRIVRMSAPFAPFTGDLAEFDRLEIVRTWRFARGDRLSSN
ncbi:energy transducer TonB [Pseudomonas cremoricolorata]|uniref:Energy transducer TonB n=1 Tax=Pseudomonas cremoricolorata TaxID=157783 RepID=A0A089WGF1_9PSED|nr:energy transducer TonB [Pseudomonas cremoricolorata]AIR88395.1 energy transducer TonB [Pseudomonas cremoricolorata]